MSALSGWFASTTCEVESVRVIIHLGRANFASETAGLTGRGFHIISVRCLSWAQPNVQAPWTIPSLFYLPENKVTVKTDKSASSVSLSWAEFPPLQMES